MRDFIIPVEGQCFIDIDYSQQEYRLFAHYVGGVLLSNYVNNAFYDIHAGKITTIKEITGIEIDRKTAKALNFSALYGGKEPAIMRQLGCGAQEATRLRKLNETAAPETVQYVGAVERIAHRREPIRTVGGRIYFAEPGREHALINYLIQGGCADITKAAMIGAADAGLELILTVHDELVVTTPSSDAGRVVRLLREAMQEAARDLLSPFNVDVKWSKRSFGELEEWIEAGLHEVKYIQVVE
jgi:DNA polymerase I-like protein with 3'-5' exonuclease and polymerase domains